MAGVNDSDRDAQDLAKLLSGMGAHINLIPVNPVKERGYRQTKDAGVRAFQKKLEKSGINVSIRRVLGRDIDGACGQLRHRHISGCNEQNASSRTEE
jgi:23S rRNA (adenine2503-C2)-methyltransferase